ncbi:MAG: hypothetical protein IPO81_27725 [Kouleothrix sp.]|nr:hypothetical protein [Kouleothrix sp.]
MVTDDPLLEELTQEAERRGVELQQHIYDLLRGRYLLRRGESLATLLWLPGTSAAGDDAEEPDAANVGAAHDRMAGAAASAWADLLARSDG